MQRQTLGFIGLGRMGTPMVRRLTEAGHHVVVYDTRPDAAKGLPSEHTTFVASPKAVGDEAGIVFCSLPTPQIVREVVLGDQGTLAGAAKGAVLVDMTKGQDHRRRVHHGTDHGKDHLHVAGKQEHRVGRRTDIGWDRRRT